MLPNISPATAVVWPSLPQSITLTQSDIDPINGACSPTTLATDAEFGIRASPFLSSARGDINVLEADGVTCINPCGLVDQAAQIPCLPLTVYYFVIFPSGPAVGTCTYDVHLPPLTLAPIGSIVIPDDKVPWPAFIMNTSGTLLRAVPFPAGEHGDVLPDGTMCVEVVDATHAVVNVDVYTSQFVLVAHVPSVVLNPNFLLISGNQNDKFYVCSQQQGGGSTTVFTIDNTGAVGGTTWTLPLGTVGDIAVAPDDSILYWRELFGGSNAIHRWDLVNDVALSDLVGDVVGFQVTRDLLVLSDLTVIAPYVSGTPALSFIRHYSAAGATLNDYATGALAVGTMDHTAHALDDPNSFWVWFQDATVFSLGATLSTFVNIKVSDGTLLHNFNIGDFEEGVGPPLAENNQFFGPSNSCPFFLITQPLIPPVTGLTLFCPATVLANLGAFYNDDFTVTGGTAPYTFAIIAGALPPDTTLNTATGFVTGFLMTTGVYNFTGQVTDSLGATDTASCSITVVEPAPPEICGPPAPATPVITTPIISTGSPVTGQPGVIVE